MSPARNWREVKAEAHRRHPELAEPEAQAAAAAQLDAYIAGHQDPGWDRTDGRAEIP
ncbi:hypothetical protein ACFYT3_29035 [Nocardia amikacinitolerans]|uniref:hypothetical protein n=1 Tax=Nocardia amikacinitolerans TaxID=756689 RepID=UPI0020A5A30F|nr:hypothetical protein [Nocardia amikacinitolerans]MCP2277684.1 hypothetical protein [Nocardia amikacinitolerans]MCP2290450.1 hypothetical protein [Nocardia amikacinitolerans]MCP2299622.1 hypothetical protein [Nocardia amikacinitolerans]